MRKRGARNRPAADPSAFLRAIGLQHNMDDAQQRDLTLRVRLALLALSRGVGMQQHVFDLASAVNVALVLTERGAAREFQADIIAAQTALMRTIERGQRSDRWGFDGPALGQVERAIEIYEAQLAAVPCIAARDAVREVMRRVAQGHVFEVVRGVADGA